MMLTVCCWGFFLIRIHQTSSQMFTPKQRGPHLYRNEHSLVPRQTQSHVKVACVSKRL